MNPFPIGKLPANVLSRLLDGCMPDDPCVVVGPRLGEDAAVIDVGDRYLVATTDPITFATDEIGWYAVHVNANDLACCGASPRWFLATILLPETGATETLVASIFEQIADACRQVGVSLVGGHTEITTGLDRPIVAGQMLGEVAKDRYVTTGGARAGDALILTKAIAIEGTALIAREKDRNLDDVLSTGVLARCRRLLHEPGISVVRDARLALDAGEVHALHDPTEGGIATGLRELAQAAGVGLAIDEDRLPVLPECATACRHLGLDPLGLIASGSLLIAAARETADAIVAGLTAAGIQATIIGETVPPEIGLTMLSADGTTRPLPCFTRDEITRLF